MAKVHHIIILFLCVAIVTASILLQFDEDGLSLFGLNWPVHCFLHNTFGVKCALCGLTRSFCSLARGNLPASLRFHFLGPLIFAFICLQIPYRIWALSILPAQINTRLTKVNSALALTLTIAVFVNWFIYLGGLIL